MRCKDVNEGIVMFGGEWTDGRTTRFFGDLLRYNVSKDQWKVIRKGGWHPLPDQVSSQSSSAITCMSLGENLDQAGSQVLCILRSCGDSTSLPSLGNNCNHRRR